MAGEGGLNIGLIILNSDYDAQYLDGHFESLPGVKKDKPMMEAMLKD